MKLFDIRKVMVLVAISIHEARVSSTFFGGLKASLVSKGLCCDKVWGFGFFHLAHVSVVFTESRS